METVVLKALILLVISILPIILLSIYIYKKDTNKEPKKLLLKLFISGIVTAILVILVSVILRFISPVFAFDSEDLSLFELVINIFIGVALVEEFCKWLMAYRVSYKNKEFDEFYDAIVYCVFVSLGFACLENLLYIFTKGALNKKFVDSLTTGISRAFLSVPGHVCFGIYMGYYFGLAKIADLNNNKALKNKNLFMSILIPTLLHGIYDYCIFSKISILMILDLIFVVFMFIHAHKKIKKVSKHNKKIKYQDNYCSNCGHIVDSPYCPICGRENK